MACQCHSAGTRTGRAFATSVAIRSPLGCAARVFCGVLDGLFFYNCLRALPARRAFYFFYARSGGEAKAFFSSGWEGPCPVGIAPPLSREKQRQRKKTSARGAAFGVSSRLSNALPIPRGLLRPLRGSASPRATRADARRISPRALAGGFAVPSAPSLRFASAHFAEGLCERIPQRWRIMRCTPASAQASSDRLRRRPSVGPYLRVAFGEGIPSARGRWLVVGPSLRLGYFRFAPIGVSQTSAIGTPNPAPPSALR